MQKTTMIIGIRKYLRHHKDSGSERLVYGSNAYLRIPSPASSLFPELAATPNFMEYGICNTILSMQSLFFCDLLNYMDDKEKINKTIRLKIHNLETQWYLLYNQDSKENQDFECNCNYCKAVQIEDSGGKMVDGKNISFRLYSNKEEGSGWSGNLEICYVLRGKIHLNIMKNKQWQICENDIFVINMYEIYQILPELDGLVLSLSIPGNMVLSLYPELEHLKIECFSFLFKDNDQEHFDRIRENMADIFELYSKNNSKMQLQVRALVSSLLSTLIISFGKTKEYNVEKKGIEQLGMLVNYVGQHYREDISLGKYAEKSHYSSSHLSHLMRNELGISFTEYLKNVRLQHALQLLRQGRSITEISEDVGFVNSNAFIKAFRDTYGMTPGKYKNTQDKIVVKAVTETELLTDIPDTASHLFDRLFTYSNKNNLKEVEETGIAGVDLCKISVSMHKSKKEISESWKFSINGGYAKRIMYEEVRRAIRKIQDEIGFRYIRCKGIFDDELQVCSRDMNGNLVLNYVFLDNILDFICSCNARPWIELSFMPSALCRKVHKEERDVWLIAMPDELQEWLDVVHHILIHLEERYGEKVNQWIITPFADIFLVNVHMQNKGGYFELYEKTYELIRITLPKVKIAARGTFEKDGSGLGNYMVEKKLLPDFWTMIDYNSVFPTAEKSEMNLIESMEAYSMIISKDTEHLKHNIAQQKKELERYGIGNVPLVLAEWNSTIWQRDLCSDTAYKSCYLLKSILENCNDISGFSYWHVSDWNDDYLPSPNRFHGGFGLFTRDNIPKSAYGAFLLLNMAEGKIQKQGKGYMVISTEEKIMIYLYNYCPYDILYRYRHIRNISLCNRYDVFETKNNVSYHITLEGMREGVYREKIYQISPGEGSACDAWMQMGGPEKINEIERSYILAASVPKCWINQVEVDKECVIQSVLEPHTIQLIELHRISD